VLFLTMLALPSLAAILLLARSVYRNPEKGGRWLPATCGLGAVVVLVCGEVYWRGAPEVGCGMLLLSGSAVAIPLLRYLRRQEEMVARRSWLLWAAIALLVALSLGIVWLSVMFLLFGAWLDLAI
jgi:hypothetical protein